MRKFIFLFFIYFLLMIHTAEIPNKPPTIVFQKIISCTKKKDEVAVFEQFNYL